MCVKEKALTIKDLKLEIKTLKLLKEWILHRVQCHLYCSFTYPFIAYMFPISCFKYTPNTVCIIYIVYPAFRNSYVTANAWHRSLYCFRVQGYMCTSKYVNACTEPENLCRGHYHSCLHDSCLQAGCWSCRGGLRCSCRLVDPPPDRLPLEINNIPRWANWIDFVIELNPFCFGLSAFYLPTPDYARRLNITPPLDTKHVLL